MITILATIRQETAKLEALCIKKHLQRKGFSDINVKIFTLINSNNDYPLYIVKVPPEVLLAMGWEANDELDKLLATKKKPTINDLRQQKANLN